MTDLQMRSADFLMSSVPDKHISTYTCRIHTCTHQLSCCNAVVGEIRGRAWDPDFRGSVLWS